MENEIETTDKMVDALIGVIDKTVSPETAEAQGLLLQRLVTSGDVIPSRIPAPKNITEVGGYLNLLEALGEDDLRKQMIASVLGVAGPLPAAGLPSRPVVHFGRVANHRPAGAAQPAIPLEVRVRADLESGVGAALDEIADHGAALPVLGAPIALPELGGDAGDDVAMAAIGRLIRVVPASALANPDTDPVALARPAAGGDLRVVSRVLDPSAPRAGDVAAADWDAFTCDSAGCTVSTDSRSYLEVEPLLAAVGWHHPVPTDPVNTSDQGRWDRFSNVAGLVVGESRLGDELRLLWSSEEIAASAVRDRLDDLWDGQRFA
jgi:hypothetical protein